MTKLISIDQSLAKCAWFVWEDGIPLDSGIIRTGSAKSKAQKKDVAYFESVEKQILFVTSALVDLAEKYDVDKVVFEALSFASVGNATRDLASLYGGAIIHLGTSTRTILTLDDMKTIAPTSLKAYARNFLDINEQHDGFTTQKKPKLVKMDKKKMVVAAIAAGAEPWLEGYSMSNGKDDLSDAYLLGKYYWDKLYDS